MDEQVVLGGGVSVLDFGAKGDGVTMDTEAIQAAIDACGEEKRGVVLFPAGDYLTAAIFLKSNVTLYFAPEARLLGSTDLDDHFEPEILTAPENLTPCLIYAEDAENIGLAGPGTVDGQGSAFPFGAENFSAEDAALAETTETFLRPVLVRFRNCRHVTITGVTLQHAAAWAVHFEFCDGVRVDGVKVDNRANQNADGLDFFGCQNVLVSNCDLDCGDDAITVYVSGERIVITNCVLTSRWAAFRMGPFSTGVFRDIAVSNCVIYNTYGCGIKLQMVEGGVMENISFDNIVMEHVTGPISMRLAGWLGWRLERERSLPIGKLRGIQFSNIRATVADDAYPTGADGPRMEGEQRSCISITGVEGHQVEGVTLSNVHITYPGGGTYEEATRRDIPELRDRYPEYMMFGVLPAYGLYARHARGLTLENVRFDLASRDLRPALVCDDVEDLELSNFRAQGYPEAGSVVRLQGTRGVFIHGCRVLGDAGTFLRVEGADSRDILLAANDLRSAASAVEVADGATNQAVIE
jgi:hypothetical protein